MWPCPAGTRVPTVLSPDFPFVVRSSAHARFFLWTGKRSRLSVPDIASSYWSRDAADVCAALGSGPDGLTEAAAAERLAAVGPNSVEDAERLGPLRLLWRQVENPLVLILIFAAVVSLGLSQWVDAGIILAIVVGSSLLGFSQEYRASTAVEELKKRLALKCRVVRDGVERTVHADAIVPGDLLVLSAGNLIPADGRILDAKDFLVSEASMTGESFPVEKQPGIVPADTPLASTDERRLPRSFRSQRYGKGRRRRNGAPYGLRRNRGKAARACSGDPLRPRTTAVRLPADPVDGRDGPLRPDGEPPAPPPARRVRALRGRPRRRALARAPARDRERHAFGGCAGHGQEGVIVRRLDAIENLGSMTVLCTDKTGTLTEGTIVLAEAADPNGVASPAVRQLAFLNAAFETGIDNPIDAAIVTAGSQAGLSTEGHVKIDEIPYDFLRKRLTIVMSEPGVPERHLVVTKGAFSNVLSICTHVQWDGATLPMTKVVTAALSAYYEAQGKAGFRVLALATRTFSAKGAYQHDDEAEMIFAGFLLFLDPPKADAARVIGELAKLNVEVKVITGDNRFVTAHLAETMGLDPKSMLTGDALAKLADEALWHAAPRTSLFAEIDPQQKERIVRALQRMGHAVGYLGDGINDAPALHAADVGISVDQAVDVARESADIILLKRDLGVLRTGVEDGRRTFANTLKYISITTSANFGNMVSMALAAPLLPFLPLVAKQILLNNFLSDVPSMAISTDRVDCRASHAPAALERQGGAALHGRLWPRELRLRPPDVRRTAPGLSCRRSHVPDDLVRRVPAHRAGRRARPAHAGPRLAQPAECPPALDDGFGHGIRPRHPVLRIRVQALRLRPALDRRDGHRHRHRHRLSRGDRNGQVVVLPGSRPASRFSPCRRRIPNDMMRVAHGWNQDACIVDFPPNGCASRRAIAGSRIRDGRARLSP